VASRSDYALFFVREGRDGFARAIKIGKRRHTKQIRRNRNDAVFRELIADSLTQSVNPKIS
jgi:hypothetical protein